MAHSWRPASAAFALAVLIAACMGVASLGAQAPSSGAKPQSPGGKWSAPRTLDGQPDLQGTWANNSVTPLERPEAFKGRATMTDAEFIAEVNQKKLTLEPEDGEFLERLINRIYATPKAIVDRVASLIK